MDFAAAVKANGSVMHGSTEIALTQQAYVENSARGGVQYQAVGIDQQGNQYMVVWDTTQAWDDAQEAYHAAMRNGGNPDAGILGDESNACDWEAPVSIKLIETAEQMHPDLPKKPVGKPRKHPNNAEKTAASEQRWRDAGNYPAKAWIPDTPEARQTLKDFAAQLRRDAGTVLPELDTLGYDHERQYGNH